MAIAFDAAANSGAKANASSWTWNHTCSGANRILVVSIAWYLGGPITSVTYNGVALTRAAQQAFNGYTAEIWYLVNPGAGASYQVAVSFTGGSYGAAGSVSLTGADQTSPIDTLAGNTQQTGTSNSVTLITDKKGCYLIDCLKTDNTIAGGSQGAGQTLQFLIESTNINGNGQSTKPTVAAGTYSMSYSGFTTSQNLMLVAVAIAPAITTAYKDIATRFYLTARSFKDVSARFLLGRGRSYKDISTRFVLQAYAFTTVTQSKSKSQTFAQLVTGLQPGKTYHYRAFATNSEGTSYGADQTFKTSSVGGDPHLDQRIFDHVDRIE